MKKHLPSINFGKVSWLLCLSFCLSFLSAKVTATPLSGIYTINPSQATSPTNFNSLTEAIDTLKVNGVSGQVTFNIAAGTYVGPFVISDIPGASAMNTITFQSAAMHADSVSLERYDGETDPVVILDSASYVTLRYLTLFSFGPGVELTRQASFNTIDSCKIQNASIPVYANNFLGGNNRFSHNILGGYDQAIYFHGVSDSFRTDSNIFSDNTMSLGPLSNFPVCSFQYIQDFKISNNIISGVNAKGIAINGSYGGLEITGNKMTISSEGLSLINVFATVVSPAYIVNNVVICTATGTAIINKTSSWQRFYHNSVRSLGVGMLVDYNTSSSDNEWRNNIVTSGNAVVGNITNNGTNNTWNYNLYTRIGIMMYFTGYANFTAWKTATGQDMNSVTGSPGFVNSSSDLRLKDVCSGVQLGILLPGVTTDIEGNLRNNPPTKGAYEYIDSNSIAVQSPLVSPSGGGYAAGSYDVTVNVKNLGANIITSFNISYTLNNGTPVSQLWTGTLAPCSVVSSTFTGSNQINLTNPVNTLKVYTDMPNNANELRPADDTLTSTLYLALDGPHTIGHSGADFSSFSEAAFALNNGGVSGPVLFEVASGTYDENFSISSVAGASLTNTITFVSAANHADSVVIENTAQASPVIDINSGNVSFKYMTVNANGGHAFQLSGTTSYDSITYCKMMMANAGINAVNLTGYNNIFSHNTITGNSGIWLYGTSETETTDTNVISYNTVNASGYGFYCHYANKLTIENNKVTSENSGLYMNYCDSGVTMNNAISGNFVGLQHENSKGHLFYHNSILSSDGHGVFLNYDGPQWAGNEWRNNIIASYSTSSNSMYLQNTVSGSNAWDYNLYYKPGTLTDLISGQPDLASWQTATAQDTHSVSLNPGFASLTDLHLTSSCIGQGISLPAVLTDLDGNMRSNPPMMGAYEYLLIDNIGVDLLITPSASTVSISGPQDLIVRVRNNGTNIVSAFNISYTLNNGSPVSQAWVGTLNPCDTVSVTFNGIQQITLANVSEIAVYTDQPNFTSDTRPEDDTLKTTLYTPLNGTYIIGPNPGAHFASLNDALDLLDAIGVNGPVVFNIQTGVYTGQIVFPDNITGSSMANNITIQSESGHADSVTIAYDIDSYLTPYVVKMGEASYITFKDITFTILAQYYYNAILLNGSASYDTIIGCKFNGPEAIDESSSTGLILGENMTGVNNAFIKNDFNIGTNGIRLQGASSPQPLGNSVTIDSNTFLNNYTTAVHITNINTVKLRNNTITCSTPHDNYTAILLDRSFTEVDIIANKINARVAGGRGILLTECSGTSSRPQMITNNSIIMIGLSGIGGIEIQAGSYQEYYHNSVNVNAPNATIESSALLLGAFDPGFKLKNNIISYNGGGCAVFYQNGFNPAAIESDYNNIYTHGGTLIAEPPASFFATLSDWQAATGSDLNSISIDPPFADDTLLLQLTNACAKVITLPAVTRDIEGNVRATPPLIGAYELALPSDDILAIGSILQPVAPFDPGTYEMKVTVQNIAAATQTSFDVSYRRDGIDTVTVLWTGSLPQCAIDTAIFTGVTMNSKNDFILYTSHPSDSNRTNDTLKTSLYAAFAGTYTIGGASPDFSSFSEAVSAIKNGGMNGAVTFDVAAGATYPENPLVLADIPGKSLHALTFQKSGAGTNPLISGSNGKAGADAVVSIINMDSVTFDGIDVRDDAGNADVPAKMEYGYYISSSTPTGSKNNTIKNCRITLSRPAGSITTGILQRGDGGNHNNRYENVKISDAYNGIMLQSMFFTTPDTNNIITSSGGDTTIIGGPNSNDIGGGSNAPYGIMLGNQKNVEVSNCVVRNVTVNGNSSMATGIYLTNTSNSTDYGNAVIKNNRIYGIRSTHISANTGSGATGLRIDVAANATATVLNNIIYDLSKSNPASIANTTPYLRGISHNISGNGSAKYFNNTVYISSGSAANVSSTAFWKGGTGVPEIRNNMFINVTPAQTGLAKHFAMYLNTAAMIQSSHNLLWAADTNGNVGYRTTDLETMQDWRTATGQDTSSVYYLPEMDLTTYNVNTADSSSWAVNGRGIHVSGVTTDILGNARPANRAAGLPDIGAYEITPDSAVPAPLALAIPASPVAGTTQVFLSPLIPGDTVAAINWSLFSPAPADVEVRQYVGERPPSVTASANNYMYSYVKVEMPGGAIHNYNIDLPYKTEWLGTNASDSNLIIISRNPAGSWSPDPNSSSDLSRKALVSLTSVYSDDSAIFTGTDRTTPLPVKLLGISASLKKNDVFVNWTTATEVNSNYFEIERNLSSDKSKWERIGNVQAKGNSSSVVNYQFIDKNAAADNKQATTIYYRLRIVDKDGRYEYSKTVSVNLNPAHQGSAVTEIFPNPFSKELYITVESADRSSVKVVLMDIAGKIISNKTYETVNGNNILDVSEDQSLLSGVYFLSVTQGNGIRTIHKVVKE